MPNSSLIITKEHRNLCFRKVTASDDPQLLEMLEENDFSGKISLLYTRRPSPIKSLARDGEKVEIVVLENRDLKKLVGMFTFVFNSLYIDGKPETVGYIGSLRLRKSDMSAITLLPAALKSLFSEYRDVRYFYSSILASNQAARRLLEKERPGLPRVHFLGSLEVYALKTGGLKKRNQHGMGRQWGRCRGPAPAEGGSGRRGQRLERDAALTALHGLCGLTPPVSKETPPHYGNFHFRQCLPEDIPALLTFFASEENRRSLFPVLSEKELNEGIRNPLISDFYLLTSQEGEILAAGAVWNQQEYKQYIVQDFSRKYRILFFFLNILTFLGFPRIEKPGKMMNFFTLSFLAVKEGKSDYFKVFLKQIKAVTGHYAYFIAGFYQDDPLKKVCRRLPHFLYKSNIFLVYAGPPGEQHKKLSNDGRIPYFECGRL